MLGGIFFISVLAEAEEVTTEEEPEAMLGLLDYVLLLAIAGIGYYWFFMRDSESDKIPEVSPKYFEYNFLKFVKYFSTR